MGGSVGVLAGMQMGQAFMMQQITKQRQKVVKEQEYSSENGFDFRAFQQDPKQWNNIRVLLQQNRLSEAAELIEKLEKGPLKTSLQEDLNRKMTFHDIKEIVGSNFWVE